MEEKNKTWVELKQETIDRLNNKFVIALKLVKRKQAIRKLFGIVFFSRNKDLGSIFNIILYYI